MTSSSNAYWAALGIRVPRVEDAMSRAGANYHSLLVVALLERGAPMTLDEVAGRFEEAGVASGSSASARRRPGDWRGCAAFSSTRPRPLARKPWSWST